MSHNRKTRRARTSGNGCSLLWGWSLASPGVGVLDGLHALSVEKAMQPLRVGADRSEASHGGKLLLQGSQTAQVGG
jgi:hypothetical protein